MSGRLTTPAVSDDTSARFASLAEELCGEVAQGFTSAIQLHVVHRGETVCDLAVGERQPGLPSTPDDMYNLYCGTKPVVALALLAELERHGCTPSSAIADLVDGPIDPIAPIDPSVTVGDVLSHQAGLVQPRLIDCYLGVSDPVAALNARAIAPQAVKGRPAYSETAAWALVAGACCSLGSTSLVDLFERHMSCCPPGVALRLRSDEATARVGCYYDMKPRPPVPMLHDRLPRFFASPFGGLTVGYASMRGLAGWYGRVLAARAGTELEGFPSPALVAEATSPQRPSLHDVVLDRACSFGYGFMTGLADHGFGPLPSPRAFGHSGFLSNSFALADPDSDLVIAFISAGLAPQRSISADVSRPLLVSAIHAALGLPCDR